MNEPPASRIINEAIERFRQDRSSFSLDRVVQRYHATDKESEEAFLDEIQNALRLDVLFREFREHLPAGKYDEERRNA